MKVLAIWKVPATATGLFCHMMRLADKRRDSPAVLLNFLAGFNFFYETEESFGDISEETALRIAEREQMNITLYD